MMQAALGRAVITPRYRCLKGLAHTAGFPLKSVGGREQVSLSAALSSRPICRIGSIVEQNDNNFDGIINNTPQTPTVGELEQKAKAGEPISLIDLANAIQADKERGKEEKPSIRAQLRAAKEQTAQRKAQRSKTQDLERS